MCVLTQCSPARPHTHKRERRALWNESNKALKFKATWQHARPVNFCPPEGPKLASREISCTRLQLCDDRDRKRNKCGEDCTHGASVTRWCQFLCACPLSPRPQSCPPFNLQTLRNLLSFLCVSVMQQFSASALCAHKITRQERERAEHFFAILSGVPLPHPSLSSATL